VRDIATNETYCPRWDKGWGYEVDHSHPAAQAWYESLVELWAEWGIDLIKLDCVNAEDELVAHRQDIISLSSAMGRSSNDFIFSLSPGGFANMSQMADIRPFVSMARATDDFWDTWSLYMDSGGGGGASSGYSHWDAARDLVSVVRSQAPTFWIDLDMLPFGRIGHPGEHCTSSGPGCARQSRYTLDETKSVFTLWSLVQSPLLMGGDVRTGELGADISAILAHPGLHRMTSDISMAAEALRVNNTATGGGGFIVWRTQPALHTKPGLHAAPHQYIAVFNLIDAHSTYTITWADVGVVPPPSSSSTLVDVWADQPFTHHTNLNFTASLAPHGVLLVKLG
jgi:alpha-galactosidase